jgi:O-antigen ligase
MLKKLLLFLLFTIFIVVYPPLFDYFELPKVLFFVVMMPILIASYVVSISLAASSARGNLSQFTQVPRLIYVVLLFVLSAVISSLLSYSSDSIWGQPYRYQGSIFFIFLTGFAYILSQHKLYGLSLTTLCRTLAVAGLLNVSLILIQGLLSVLGFGIFTFDGRMTGLIGNPNFAGGVIALSYPYIFYELRTKETLLLLATSAAAVAVFFTDSRGAIIALAVAIMLLFLKHAPIKKVAVYGIILACIGIYFFPNRLSSSFDSRTIIWQKAWSAVQQKPVFGWGLENFSTAFQAQLLPEGDFDLKRIRVDKAHNEFLEMLVATGIVGATLYVVTVGYTLWILLKNQTKSSASVMYSTAVSVVAFIILAQVNVLSITEYIFLYIGVAVAAAQCKKEKLHNQS